MPRSEHTTHLFCFYCSHPCIKEINMNKNSQQLVQIPASTIPSDYSEGIYPIRGTKNPNKKQQCYLGRWSLRELSLKSFKAL